jgi:hypothetical protein
MFMLQLYEGHALTALVQPLLSNNIGAGSARQHLDLAARARLGPSCSLLGPQSVRACSRSVPPNQSMPSDGRVPKLQSWYTWCR